MSNRSAPKPSTSSSPEKSSEIPERGTEAPKEDTGAPEEGTRTKTKVAIICTSCRAVYAAEKSPSGKLRPIGREDGCRCGDAAFVVVGDSE